MTGVSFYNLLAGVSVGIFMTRGPADCNGAGLAVRAALSPAPAVCIPLVHVSVVASWPSYGDGPSPSNEGLLQQKWSMKTPSVSQKMKWL